MKSEAFNIDNMIGMKDCPENWYDLAVVDPPYFKGVGKHGYFGDNNSSIGVKRGNYNLPQWDNQIPDKRYFKELLRVSKHQIIWGINYFPGQINSAGRIIWDKVNDYSTFSKCEIASCSLINTVQQFRYMWAGMNQGSRENGSRMEGNKKKNEVRIHPTQKPIALYEWIFKNYAEEGQKILDTHLGSGSSRIAAFNYKMDFTGYEIDKDYFDASEKRFKNHVAQLKMFV